MPPMGDDVTPAVRVAGTVLGNYEILELLGEGGMGQVYLAQHIRLKRKVALKLLLPRFADNEEIAKRFFAEARSVNAVESEHIVEITDFVEDGKDKFFVMELLDGEALSEIMGRGQLPLERVLDIALQLAATLQQVHVAGIIHRDLKPDNIVLVERAGRKDFVKLLDFGIAKIVDEEAFDESEVALDTSDGAVLGTPAYVSPEQLKGETLDNRADIYAFGLLLFQLITGKRPFRSRSLPELVLKQMTEQAPSISDLELAPYAIPTALDSLVRRCLEKDRALRPPTMGHIISELEMVRDGEAPEDEDPFAEASSAGYRPPPIDRVLAKLPEPLRELPRPAQLAVLASPIVLLVLVVIIALAAGGGDDAPPQVAAGGDAPKAAAPSGPRAAQLERIDGGDAKTVLAEIESVEASGRSPGDELIRGHALAKLGRDDDAMEVYAGLTQATPPVLDARAMKLALSRLEERKPPKAMDLLTNWPDDTVRAPLYDLANNGGWWPRHHAAFILESRKQDDELDREKLAIIDLNTGPNCGTRKYGAKQLGEHGKSQAALDAIDAAAARDDNGCMKKTIKAVRRSVESRAKRQ
jgi:serine/threonine-protein kinase